METQTRLSRHNKFISPENIVGIYICIHIYTYIYYIYAYIYIYIYIRI